MLAVGGVCVCACMLLVVWRVLISVGVSWLRFGVRCGVFGVWCVSCVVCLL